MAKNYKAKTAYQNQVVAEKYDVKRFISIKGKTTNSMEKNAILKALNVIPEGSKVIDVPCGTGRVTEWLLEKKYTVEGFDISNEMIDQAKDKLSDYPNLTGFHVGDATNIELDDNSFDCVVSVRLLGHTPSKERIKILKEFKRLSKDWVIITFYHSNCLQGFLRKFKGIIFGERRIWFPVNTKQIENELAEVGLEKVAVYPILKYISETWVVITRKKTVK